jgi:hypothetical protein
MRQEQQLQLQQKKLVLAQKMLQEWQHQLQKRVVLRKTLNKYLP